MKSAKLAQMVEHVTRQPKDPQPKPKGKPWRGTLKELAAHGRKGLRKMQEREHG